MKWFLKNKLVTLLLVVVIVTFIGGFTNHYQWWITGICIFFIWVIKASDESNDNLAV